jgi:hypothetical protein
MTRRSSSAVREMVNPRTLHHGLQQSRPARSNRDQYAPVNRVKDGRRLGVWPVGAIRLTGGGHPDQTLRRLRS